MKKLNIKQPKYIIPLIALPILLFIGYQVVTMLKTNTHEDTRVVTEDVNTDMPEANLDKMAIKSKYKTMSENFVRGKDYTAVEGVDREEIEKMSIESSYSDDEKARMDSLEELRRQEERQLQQLIEQTNNAVAGSGKNTQDSQQLSDIERQLQLIQRMADGQEILSPAEEMSRKAEDERQRRLADSLAEARRPRDVFKAGAAHEESFNTVGVKDSKQRLIRGRVDELVKATEGSRLRIRLSDDIEINGTLIPKGTYLYANVTGFNAQRVTATVKSMMVNGEITPVELTVYDMDCQEGFYVPSSAFRDLAKNAGAGAMGGVNVNMSSSGQDLQSVAMQSLQQALTATTSAVSSSIKKNRAKIKYNTEVYLISKNGN
jgi:conjugative transposon TraM protein